MAIYKCIQGFELGATVKQIQVVFRATLEPGTARLQVRRADISVTLPTEIPRRLDPNNLFWEKFVWTGTRKSHVTKGMVYSSKPRLNLVPRVPHLPDLPRERGKTIAQDGHVSPKIWQVSITLFCLYWARGSVDYVFTTNKLRTIWFSGATPGGNSSSYRSCGSVKDVRTLHIAIISSRRRMKNCSPRPRLCIEDGGLSNIPAL